MFAKKVKQKKTSHTIRPKNMDKK